MCPCKKKKKASVAKKAGAIGNYNKWKSIQRSKAQYSKVKSKLKSEGRWRTRRTLGESWAKASQLRFKQKTGGAAIRIPKSAKMGKARVRKRNGNGKKSMFHATEDRLIRTAPRGGNLKRKRKKKPGLPLWASALPVRQPRSARPRKHPPMCIKQSRATAGVYMKGNTTKRKPRMRIKTIGARRGKKRGAQWIDDDYLANMPVKGGKYRKQGGPKYDFLE